MSDKTLLPAIVDEDGNALEGPEMEKVSSLIISLAQLANAARTRIAVELPIVKGYTTSMTIPVTGNQNKIYLLTVNPYEAWATVSFTNKGPDSVFINLNNNNTEFKQLDSPGIWEVDFSKAKRRLEIIELHCAVGQMATVLADGKY
jgi:hypothetical protein